LKVWERKIKGFVNPNETRNQKSENDCVRGSMSENPIGNPIAFGLFSLKCLRPEPFFCEEDDGEAAKGSF
jgi:hypothetical protein